MTVTTLFKAISVVGTVTVTLFKATLYKAISDVGTVTVTIPCIKLSPWWEQ